MAKPKPPGYIDKVNGIISFVQNPCDAPWVVYAELALPAAGEVILELLDFGFDDVVRGALRPRGTRSFGHTRRGGKGGGASKGLPELGELIGANIPGTDAARGRAVSDGVKRLWVLDGIIQRGLWYWLVAELTLDFFYNWTSALQTSRYCIAAQGNAAYAESIPTAGFGGIGVWTAIASPIQIYKRGTAEALSGVCTNAGKPFSSGASLNGQNPTIFDVTIFVRKVVNGHVTEVSPSKTASAGEESEFIISDAAGPGKSVGYQHLGVGLGYLIGQGNCWTMG